MSEEKKTEVRTGLYYAAIGQMIMDQVDRVHHTAISQAMESRAIQILEAVRNILEDHTLDDPECFERIDALVMLYARELGIIVDRHIELE